MPNPFSWLATPFLRLSTWTKQAFSSNRDQEGHSGIARFGSGDWGSLAARQQRYAYWWSFFESTVYDDIHTFAQKNKIELGLYEDIEPIGNPVAQICEFWHTHLWGGALDKDAGDGTQVPSALPIETENENLRPPLARLWRDSVWQVNKDVVTLQGAVKGDVGIAVVDDTERGRVCLQVIDPTEILDYTADLYGNCRSYVLERRVLDPRWKPGREALPQEHVRYREICWRDGEMVHYETYLDDDLYPWNEQTGAQWDVPYGFVPFVLIPHTKILPDSPFGAPECHAGRRKFHALDHMASMTMDNIGKSVDPVWLTAGVPNPDEGPDIPGDDPDYAAPKPRRGTTQTVYTTDPNSKAQALVTNLNLNHVTGFFDRIFDIVKRDYPEMRLDMEFAAGDASGRALRVARQRLERKATMRRANYDDGLVRVQKMALSIGGFQEYEGYTDFDLGSYARGELDHRIGDRSLFQVDPEDRLDLEAKEAQNADTWAMAGVPVLATLKLRGWSDKRLAIVRAAQELDLDRGLTVGRSKQQAQGSVGTAGEAVPQKAISVSQREA